MSKCKIIGFNISSVDAPTGTRALVLTRINIFFAVLLFLFLHCSYAFSETSDVDEQYKYALGLYKRSLYEESATVLKKVLAEKIPFTKRDGAWFWLGESFVNSSKFTDAISAFNTLLKEYPKSEYFDRGCYSLGWAHVRDNNPKSAIEAFSKVSKSDPTYFVDSRLKMGQLAGKFNFEPDKILEIYNELLSYPDLPPEKKSDALLQQGIQLFNLEKYDDAFKSFEESLKIFPRSNRQGILFYEAECMFRNKSYSQAEPIFKRLIDGEPKSEIKYKALYDLAWCKIKASKHEEAINLLSQLAYDHKAPNNIEAQKNLIDLLMNLKKFDLAISWMEKIEEFLSPDESVEMNYRRGLALSRTGNFSEAKRVFNNFIKKYPKHAKTADARYQIGLVDIALGNFKEALDDLTPLLRRETPPEVREKAIYRVGESYFNLGNLKGARDSFERLLREYPNGSTKLDALYQFAEIEYSAGNLKDALEAFSNLSLSGGEIAGQAAFRMGEVLMKAGKFAEAISTFEDYIKKFPSGALVEDARFKIGLSYQELKDPGKALAAFSEIRESKGYFRQEARYQIAEIARSTGNFPVAIQQLKAIINEDPKNPLASRSRRAIGICLYQAKDFSGAIETFEAILKDYPSTDIAIPESRLWLGRSFIALGKTEDGILEILKIPVLYPKSSLVSEAFAEAARTYSEKGLNEKAKKMWKEVLKSQPKGPLADEAHKYVKKG
ncbi:MAG: tetratricopeptide repeat protein [Candidatus Riflebacteria bacterium]|nr:tetratricopeptide repeat protein [Candidatus Riflebacteria bacterium]